jgi:hypothetical protein
VSHEFRVRALLGLVCGLLIVIAWNLAEIGEQLDTLTGVLR